MTGSTRTLLPSLIRTYVPLAVSWLAGWLLTLGINVTDDDQAKLASGFGVVVAALYYALARVLERQFPWATMLLGSPVQPAAYLPAARPAIPAIEVAKEVTADAERGELDPDADTYGRHAAPVDPAAGQ